METLLIEITNPKARKLIDDLVELELISVKETQPSRTELWKRLENQLPQAEPDITEEDILEEGKAYRQENL